MNSSLKCPPFEWNRQHFSRNPSEKDALTDTRKTIAILRLHPRDLWHDIIFDPPYWCTKLAKNFTRVTQLAAIFGVILL